MEELRDQRSNRAAGHDDRSFRAERSARPDRDRRGNRLEHGDLRLDAAAVDQDRFDRLWNAMAANAIRAVARHQADDQRPGHRHQDDERSEVVARRRHQVGGEALEEEQIGKESDQFEECGRDERRAQADRDRKAGIGRTRAVAVKSPR
jgi:hypothetical protein